MHTFDEVLKWFDLNDIEFINSIPSLESFNDNEIFEKIKIEEINYLGC